MIVSNYAIVAIGYNRSDGMLRLLESLARAEYGGDNVTLIISIDNSGTDTIEQCAKMFDWKHGVKRIVTYPERQGLRRHILNCGNFVKEFDAIAVFEDDIIASPGFYSYMKAAVSYYEKDDRIAGISLYTHLWNVNINMPFQPSYSPYDVFFFQFAQSWGQIWMRRQWLDFVRWYGNNSEEFGGDEEIPGYVSGWPGTSWLKYHIKYCIKMNKYFVYPYCSLATCFSDLGEHCRVKETYLQVPMMPYSKQRYSFVSIDAGDAVKYDAFFERILPEIHDISARDICMDLYGSRDSFLNKRYVISSRQLPYRVEKSYGAELRPQEENIILDIKGDIFCLYDTHYAAKNRAKSNGLELFKYYMRIHGRGMIPLMIKYCLNKVKQKLLMGKRRNC